MPLDRAQLWGTAQKSELSDELSQFLPVMVSRLDPPMQDRVISFYNSLLHWLSRPEVSAELVPSLRETLSQALTQFSGVCPERADFDLLAGHRSNASDPRTIDNLAGLARKAPAYDVTARFLTVPDDLYIIEKSGLVDSHWRMLMTRIKGNYTPFRSSATPPQAGDHDAKGSWQKPLLVQL